MALVAYVIMLAYTSPNEQWARFACPLVISSKTNLCQFSSVQFNYSMSFCKHFYSVYCILLNI